MGVSRNNIPKDVESLLRTVVEQPDRRRIMQRLFQ